MDEDELFAYAKEIQAPYALVKETALLGRLPVVNFAAGGVATPADAALMMQLGVDGVFVGSGIFKSGNPVERGKAIVQAVTHYNDPEVLAEVSMNLGEPMVGINVDSLSEQERLARRGLVGIGIGEWGCGVVGYWQTWSCMDQSLALRHPTTHYCPTAPRPTNTLATN